ncbi:hypothetical protein [Candidatus Pristimantibacillus sp. PTI5]|uniref:hypothetical protein n=1 Tax=Candidatus Pristimantibacillus sp. PTI5 TaxID=3400422 RepID=UPI003B027084
MKTCNNCNEIKSLNDFYKDKKGKFGRKGKCKKCYYPTVKKAKDKREQMMKTVTNSLRESEKERILKHFQYECALTGKYDHVGLDHFVPLSWGSIVHEYEIGGTTYANTIPFHRSINSSKGAMNPFIWFKEYGNRHGVTREKWDDVIKYIAEKHGLSVCDYTNRVNACYSEIIAKKWIADINSKIESEGNVHLVFIDRALRNNLNIAVVAGLYGSSTTKDYFRSSQGLDLLKERKEVFQSRLNRR